MRLILILLLISPLCLAQSLVAKKSDKGRGYLEYLPSDYATSNKYYPTIIWLHGSGERGDGSAAQLERLKGWGPPKFIASGSKMCFTVRGEEKCFIVLCPQQTTSRWGWQGDVIPFVKSMLAAYRIDPNQLYLTGLSMGGDGTWDASYASDNVANYFTAIAPVSCKGDYNGGKITAQRKTPVKAFHGLSDTSVPLSDGMRPINGMKSVGANPAPEMVTIGGGGHNGKTWDPVFSPTHTYYNPNIYEWFLSYGMPTPPPPLKDFIDSIYSTSSDTIVYVFKSGKRIKK